jgi:L-ribulose-5-phosphate 3-epimerase
MTPTLPRREFLALTAGAGALALTSPMAAAAADAPPRKREIKKAIMYSTIGVKGSVMDKFKAVRDAGFEGVEPMGGMDQNDVLAALQATGLKAASVCCHTHWAKPLSDANPAVRQTGVDGLILSLRDAKAYGATSVLLVPAVVNEKVSYDEAYTRSQAEIRKVVPLAEELGVRIAIENVWNNFLLSPIEAARYVDEFKSAAVGWHFDIGNILRYGWPEHWIRTLGKRISRLHIKEYSRKKMNEEGVGKGFNVQFLEGDNNWPAIMKALDEIGYNSWGIAEQGGGGTPEGLKNLADRMDRIFAS